MALRIALDVDSVLADVIVLWLEIFNRLYSRSLRKSDVDSWDFWKDLGLSRWEFEEIFTKAWVNWEQIPPTEEGLSEKADALRFLGRVDIVTGRSVETLPYVKKWLDRQKVRYESFVQVPQGASKWRLEYDVFIDDSPHNVVGAAGNGRYSILYDQPWNQEVPIRPNIIRVRNLTEAAEVVKKMKAEDPSKGRSMRQYL